jgi:hypothetical protein
MMSAPSSPRTIASRMCFGSTVQYCGVGHGMCTKCWMRTSSRRSRIIPRTQVELVVLDEDEGRLVGALRLRDHPVGDKLVHGHVAVDPRTVDGLVDHRLARQVPEVVLDEPEQRVGDDVVVEVVGGGRRLDEGDLHRGAVVGGQLGGVAALGERPVGGVAGERHPDGVGGRRE